MAAGWTSATTARRCITDMASILDRAIASLRSYSDSQGTGPSYGNDPFAPGSVTGPAAILKAATSLAAAGRAKANARALADQANETADINRQHTLAQIALLRAQTAKANADAQGTGTDYTLTLPGDQGSMGDAAGPPAPAIGHYDNAKDYLGALNTMSEMEKRNTPASTESADETHRHNLVMEGIARYRLTHGGAGGAGGLGHENALLAAAERGANADTKAWDQQHEATFQQMLERDLAPYGGRAAIWNDDDQPKRDAALRAMGIPPTNWDLLTPAAKQKAVKDATDSLRKTAFDRWHLKGASGAEGSGLAPIYDTLAQIRARRTALLNDALNGPANSNPLDLQLPSQ